MEKNRWIDDADMEGRWHYLQGELLTDEQKLVLKLRFENNLSYSKIGLAIGRTHERARQKCSKALRKISLAELKARASRPTI